MFLFAFGGYPFIHENIYLLPLSLANKFTLSTHSMLLEKYRSTSRLNFRPLVPSDKAFLLSHFSRTGTMLPLPGIAELEAEVESWYERQVRRYQEPCAGLYATTLKATGQLIGYSGLVRQFVDGIPKWEIGFGGTPAFWENGYLVEAGSHFRDLGFEEEMAETLISLVPPDHGSAKQLASLLGMTFWKHTRFKNQPREVFRVRRTEWEAKR